LRLMKKEQSHDDEVANEPANALRDGPIDAPRGTRSLLAQEEGERQGRGGKLTVRKKKVIMAPMTDQGESCLPKSIIAK